MAEKEYIEREALMMYPIRCDNYDKKNGNVNFINGVESVLEYAEGLSAADVAPVKHGEWMAIGNIGFYNYYLCNQCNAVVTWRTRYCPSCGAKMNEDNS